MRWIYSILIIVLFTDFNKTHDPIEWIRINQLGYLPKGIKVAVWCSKLNLKCESWQLVDAVTNKVVKTGKSSAAFGSYGPYKQTHRLDFSSYQQPGQYYLVAAGARSPIFRIDNDVYKGAADFCLRYMRQQRTGFNPYLKDSCHTHDGYTLYGKEAGLPDSTHIDVVGGWHDASDYLQYSTTSANATYHLLAAYRDFPNAFSDEKLANGLAGKNGVADVLDEAKWGLDWLLKMHPRDDWMFNQIADDRDHMGMRIPRQDSFYGKGYQRPVYFVNGEPQQRGKLLNNTTGTSSTASKFSSAFSLGAVIFDKKDKEYSEQLYKKAYSAFRYADKKPGVTQTASVKAPYIYAEENWVDDHELAAASLANMIRYKGGQDWQKYAELGYRDAKEEKITPWLGTDTAHHYQWYPFINLGHYEMARLLEPGKNSSALASARKEIISYYKQGIEKVWVKAKGNAFYRGIPFIWCSNNLTTSFAIQCYWYEKLTGDRSFAALEQANIDWLFGCNPWGTSMVYGLPANGDTPTDPHSAFTHLGKYPIDGGLIDGPVYTSIFKSLIGIRLYEKDEFDYLQSDLAVYHDDYGDYSTNEPTMDGTASLIYLLASKESTTALLNRSFQSGAIIRGDSSKKTLALVFTGDEFADGGSFIRKTLLDKKIKASFFLTGRFYDNPAFSSLILQLKNDGHYLGPHSDQHLLYCDWSNRDSLLVSKNVFKKDLKDNLQKIGKAGVAADRVKFFLPPFEWYNDSISAWTKEMGLQLINYTPGTLSHADYTYPPLKNYRDSNEIFASIINYEKNREAGLNGFILLVHIGTDPKRKDKFYRQLPVLIKTLEAKGYQFKRVDQLL